MWPFIIFAIYEYATFEGAECMQCGMHVHVRILTKLKLQKVFTEFDVNDQQKKALLQLELSFPTSFTWLSALGKFVNEIE